MPVTVRETISVTVMVAIALDAVVKGRGDDMDGSREAAFESNRHENGEDC